MPRLKYAQDQGVTVSRASSLGTNEHPFGDPIQRVHQFETRAPRDAAQAAEAGNGDANQKTPTPSYAKSGGAYVLTRVIESCAGPPANKQGQTGGRPRFFASEQEQQRRCEYDHNTDDESRSYADYKEFAECMGVQSNKYRVTIGSRELGRYSDQQTRGLSPINL